MIDVGINVNEVGKSPAEMWNFEEEAEKIVEAITPVPRGVGGVTTSILLEHGRCRDCTEQVKRSRDYIAGLKK